MRGNIEHRKYFIGVHPIIQVFIERLRIREIIGSYILQDRRLKLPVEQTLKVLIHNILTHPMPMYEIVDWLAPLDESSLGLDRSEVEFIHDDRVGQALESFYKGKHKDVFFRLALRAIREFGLDCTYIHQDTTSITFSGKYAGWTAREFMSYGINKDHRPDLKQLVLGLSVTADGSIPLVHRVYDGNQTDDTLHVDNHRKLKKLLKRSDFIYTADCKLATETNLNKIASCGGLFITVMPRTWKEDTLFREKIRAGKIQWDLLLTRKNNRHPKSKRDRYYIARGSSMAKGYILYWIYSTQKAEQDAETRKRHTDNALEALRKIQSKLNKYHLKTRKDIDQAIKKVLNHYQCQEWIDYMIHSNRQYRTRHRKPGRPKASQTGRRIWSQYFSMSFDINNDAFEQQTLTDGIFPLITNVKPEQHKPKRILEIYKFQPFLEKRHSQLKTWQEVTPVLLKKGERLVAFLHVHIMALMTASLIERQLRLAMKKHSIEHLPIYPETRHCPYPTMADIVRLFREVERYEVEEKGKVIVFPAKLNKLQKQVLQLLEVPVSLYQ
jgi:transposase